MTKERKEWRLAIDLMSPPDTEGAWPSYRRTIMTGKDRVPDSPSSPDGSTDGKTTLAGLAVLALSRRAAAPVANRIPDQRASRFGNAPDPPSIPQTETSGDRERQDAHRCPAAAAERLASLLRASERQFRFEFLVEWLHLTVQAGWRVPPEWAPDLLELGREGRERMMLRPLIRRAVGPLGEWLSSLRPEWSWWREERETEASSEQMDELVWSIDNLFPQLSSTLQLVRGPNLQPRILLETDNDLTDKDPGESGERRSWIERSLGRIPLACWTAYWGERPRDLVGAARRSPHQDLLLRGWTEAARLPAASPLSADPLLAQQEQTEWIESLLHIRLGEPSEEGADLLSRLPEDGQERLLLRAISLSHGIAVDQPAFWYLTRSSSPWSCAVSQGLVRLLWEEIESRTVRTLWDWETLLRHAGLRFDPTLLEEVEAAFARVTGIARSRSPLAPALATFLEDLRFRATMHREIRERKTE
ncbi:MAG: DUF5691 domain-containing protein [Blastocatellia bacterium]